MQKPLLEAAGGSVLAELLLEQMVQQRLQRADASLSQADIEQERRILAASLSRDPDQAARLISEVRQRRGQTRFERRLKINAGLRKLVQPQIQVTDTAIRQAYATEYGPQYEARIIVVESLQQANRLAKQARGGTPFSELAIEHSRDATADLGGLLPPISPQDASYPKSVRDALDNLQPGQVSDPVVLDDGVAILQMQRRLAGDNRPMSQVRDELATTVRRRMEQMYMQQLARVLIQEAQVVVLDPALQQSWNDQRDALMPNQ